MKKQALLHLLMGLAFMAAAQRPLGTWRSFNSYGAVKNIAFAENEVLAAGDKALYSVDKNTHQISTIKKADGLSDVGIRASAYHSAKKAWIIAYQSSNIDLIVDNVVYNIPDIKNKVTGSSKNINSISVIGDFAYLASDIGIVVLDIEKKEIRNTYVIGNNGNNVRINAVVSDGNSFFAATDDGLKTAPLQGVNLLDYSQWKRIGPARVCQLTGAVNGNVYAVERDSLFIRNDTNLVAVRANYNWSFKQMTLSDGNLYATQWYDSTGGAFDGRILKINASGIITDIYLEGAKRPNQCIAEGNTLWVADEYAALRQYENGSFKEGFLPNSPPSPGGFDMKWANGILYAAQGSTDPSYIELSYNSDGPVEFRYGEWKRFPPNAYGIGNCYDLVSVAANASGNHVYYGSLQCGLIDWDIDNNSFTNYDESNSIIERCYPGNRKISALTVDQKGNLWMSNTCSSHGLKMKTPDGHWYQFSVPNELVTVRKMMVDSRGWVWMCGRGSTINVYDPGDDLTDPSDDHFKSLGIGEGNGALPNSNVFCMVEDKNNDVWVGTDEGIGTLFCAGSIFSTGGCDADRIKVERDGFIGYLFATEIVRCMAVDGANRKWVGTTNGLWLISADGKTEILKFTKDNSPLPVNSILSIAINQQTGEVFIGTENGMVSYQGDAILGEETKSTAVVYPNPVKPTYNGPIAIKGLVDDAYVKILDSGGTLVFQGKANGGQMIWDGKGYTGNRVATGVYIVYSATELGAERAIGKIIFMN
ncbi:MAG: two-component regulator propeller domain-containing protein [Chitinophagales bacterium]